jgi:hypothetical protein
LDGNAAAFLRAELQAQVVGLEAYRYYFYYGVSPKSFYELKSAGLAFLRPYNFFACRNATFATTAEGLQKGDFELRTFGRQGIYVGTVVDGKATPLFETADPPLPVTVATMTEDWDVDGQRINAFLCDPINFRIWAEVQTIRDVVRLYSSRIGVLQTLDELKSWGLMPFDGLGENPITGGPVLLTGTPGNILARRHFALPAGWTLQAIDLGGKPIPLPFVDYSPGHA